MCVIPNTYRTSQINGMIWRYKQEEQTKQNKQIFAISNNPLSVMLVDEYHTHIYIHISRGHDNNID